MEAVLKNHTDGSRLRRIADHAVIVGISGAVPTHHILRLLRCAHDRGDGFRQLACQRLSLARDRIVYAHIVYRVVSLVGNGIAVQTQQQLTALGRHAALIQRGIVRHCRARADNLKAEALQRRFQILLQLKHPRSLLVVGICGTGIGAERMSGIDTDFHLVPPFFSNCVPK